jgi:PAS domain S-box-containing protein
MSTKTATKQELLEELAGLRQRLEEAEETLHAIRNGEVDALVVSGPNGDNVFTLSGADRPYRVLIEAMSEGALTLSEDGTILYSNTRFAELVGMPLNHVIGAPLSQFVAAEDQPALETFIAHTGDTGARKKVNLIARGGDNIPVQLSTQPVDLGGLEAVCVIVTDLTNVVAAEEALRRAHDGLERRVEERTAELSHANELRLRFLAMISHELRTPLTSIKGFASTLLAEDVSWQPEEQREFIRTIDAEANKLTDMIGQILDLSSIEAGILHINPIPIRLSDTLGAILPELQTAAPNHELRLNVSTGLPIVAVDHSRIAQVLNNLVENAAKYSPPHTLITISAQRIDTGVQVTVADQGPGIPAKEQSRIFEAFRRGSDNQVKHTKGAGLGLAICKGLIEAHGGRIWIEEHAGPGAMISFTLPSATSSA